MERASAAIAAAGGPGDAPRIEGPQGDNAVEFRAIDARSIGFMSVHGASLHLRGVAVAGIEDSFAVECTSKGRAELAGCTLSSPGGWGLYVGDVATAEVQGGTIADCGGHGVYCGSGSKATVRTARPRTAETAR